MATSENSWPVFEITKLDAARRQLETAIWLLFEKKDSVSVHTLAFAAFGILKNVSEHRGKTRVLEAGKEIAGQSKNNFWTGFNKAGNFFKHADKDPDNILSGVPEEENEALISLAVEIYLDLECTMTPALDAFYLWWRCINFQSIEDVTEPFISWLNEHNGAFHTQDRPELLELGKDLLDRLTEQRKL